MFIKVFIILAIVFNFSAQAQSYRYSVDQRNQLVWLTNGNNIKVAVSPKHGGELAGLGIRHLNSWHQLLYRGLDYSRKKLWRGKAMLLWPATGASKMHGQALAKGRVGQYQVSGEQYPMPFHGFAKNMVWRIEQISSTEEHAQVSLVITDNDNSRAFYPFSFQLKAIYTLKAEQLTIEYQVRAGVENIADMPFSIGNHITFNAPLIAGSSREQFAFTVNSDQLFVKNDKGFPNGEILASPHLGRQTLADLPEKKSVSLTHQPTLSKVSLIDPSGVKVHLAHQASWLPDNTFLDMNLWASNKEGFISPEPWIGMQNSLNSEQGLIKLKPNQQWNWQIKLNIEPFPVILN